MLNLHILLLSEMTEKLPINLVDALKALQADTVICEALGAEFIEW